MFEKIILITRETRLEGLIRRFNTKAQAKFYIEQNGGSFAVYQQEHDVYCEALSALSRGAKRVAKVQAIERTFLPSYIFAEDDLVMTLGIDGLVVNTAKYLQGQPLLAVNPDPAHIDGILLPFDVTQALSTLKEISTVSFKSLPVSMAQVKLNDGQTLLAFNDLFVGRLDHISARYQIETAGRSERHSSSGVIISTGAGSTGWLSSLFNMAEGILDRFGSEQVDIVRPQVPWESEQLIYMVREPFVSRTSAAGIVCGSVTPKQPLVIESHMPAGGAIFSDGIATDYLHFNAGTVATIGVAAQKTRLVLP